MSYGICKMKGSINITARDYRLPLEQRQRRCLSYYISQSTGELPMTIARVHTAVSIICGMSVLRA